MNHLDEMQEEQRLYIVAQQQLHSMLLSDEHGVKAEYMEPQLDIGILESNWITVCFFPFPCFQFFPLWRAVLLQILGPLRAQLHVSL